MGNLHVFNNMIHTHYFILHLTGTYSAAQNRLTKQPNCTLVIMMITLLKSTGLPHHTGNRIYYIRYISTTSDIIIA